MNAVVLKHFYKIFAHLGAVVVAVARRVERDLASRVAHGHGVEGLQ